MQSQITRLKQWFLPAIHRVSADPVARAVAKVLSVEGQISAQEAKQLIQLARVVRPDRVIVEIGSYRGRSAVALALGTRMGDKCRVYAVDPHVEFNGVRGGHYGPQDQARLYANLTRFGVGDRVAVVSLPSTAAASAWTGPNVGLLWIDGDHRYESVRKDVACWYPNVAPGGVIAFHDVDEEGVARVVAEFSDRKLLSSLGRVGNLSWHQKSEK